MKKVLGIISVSFLLMTFFSFNVSPAPVRAEESSIIDLQPTVTPTPFATASPAAIGGESTTEELPITGTSPFLLLVLVLVLSISGGYYFLSPSNKK